MSSEQSSVGVAVVDRLLGTQAAPACEAGALARGRLMTADCSRRSAKSGGQADVSGEAAANSAAVGRRGDGFRPSRGDMARKLKSDNVLFIATILLVALSVVMVYSASAPMALERYGQASVFLVKQAMWAALGLPMLWLLMKVDYRTYRQPVVIWSCLGLVTVALVAVLFSPPINNARRWFGDRGDWRAALGVREARRDLLHRGHPRAAHASHRRGDVLAVRRSASSSSCSSVSFCSSRTSEHRCRWS